MLRGSFENFLKNAELSATKRVKDASIYVSSFRRNGDAARAAGKKDDEAQIRV